MNMEPRRAHGIRRQPVLILTAALLSLLAGGGPAVADSTKEQVCAEVAAKAQRQIWDSVRETGDELFCRKPWVQRRADEFAACALTNTVNTFGNKLKNRWNAFFAKTGAEWAQWGPRGVSEEWESGQIRGGFRRVFFGPALAYSTSTVEVIKEDGQAEGIITVCELDADGRVAGSQRKRFAPGKDGVNEARTFTYRNTANRVLGVVIDTPPSINTFEYRTRLRNVATRNNIGEVPGVADLHVHQIVNLAFGGRMYWGSYAGPKTTALAEEVITGTLRPAQGSPVEDVISRVTAPGIDANVLLWAAKPERDDEGFFQIGGRGAPDYSEWPHHADRSHQQAHISWVKEAHERGKATGSNLNLMVVSLVNNDILCAALKLIDPYGNVPIRDSQGKVAGWESASWGCSDHENVLRQLRAIHELEQEHSWYRVAMSPWHVRQIIDEGDLAVVISLETDKPLSGPGGNYGNWLQQLDEYRALGVTTMQIVHESNSRFCGAAPHRNMMQVLQLVHWPLATIGNLLRTGTAFNLDGNGYNALGITRDGEQLVDALVARNMPIDIAHGSERCRNGIMDRVPNGYGLYDSHTKFKRLMEPAPGAPNYGTGVLEREKEFLITEGILPNYRRHKVLVGLRTASIDVYSAPSAVVSNTCPGSARSFAQLVQYAHDSGLEFAYGTDFNTGVSQLGPRFGTDEQRCWADIVKKEENQRLRAKGKPIVPRRPVQDEGPLPKRAHTVAEIDGTNYYTDGLANIGWLPELTDDLIALGTPGAEKLRSSAEAFLGMWERAYDAAPETPASTTPTIPPGSLAMGLACTGDAQCRSGKCSGALGARGVCVCNEDRDCGSGQFCDQGVDTKVNACRTLLADGESCALVDGGRSCRSGQCKLGRCFTANSVAMGGACYLDDACQQGKCSSIDGTKGTCVCKADRDCGNGYWCDGGADLKQNVCKRKLASGEKCGVGVDIGHRCRSGKCILGKCK